MRLVRQLQVAGKSHQIIDEKVKLDLAAPGRAIFTVVAPEIIGTNQLVVFDLGYAGRDLQRWFIGYTEKVVPQGSARAKLFCRQLSAALANKLPLDLRHVSLRDVLTTINEKTGLNFATPDQSYAKRQVANFYNLGNGYQAMNMIGRVFNIPDYIWQQQGNGVIYVGSWADSRWSQVKNIVLPQNLFDQVQANNQARLPAMPQLRPGMRVNGKRLTEITFQQNHMDLIWKN